MKAENIYIEQNESVSEVVEKIINSESDSVVLIIPYNSKISESILNFKLIKREAAAADKKIFISSDEEEVILMAKEAGIKLLDMAEVNKPKVKHSAILGDIKPPKRKTVKKIEKEGEVLPEVEDIVNEVEKKRKSVTKETEKSKEKKFFTDYFDEDHFSEIEIDEKEIKRERPKRAIRFKLGKGGKIVVGVIAGFLVLTFLFIYFLAKAEVNVISKKTIWQEQMPILAASNMNQVDETMFKIPLTAYEFRRTVTQKFPTTEIKNIENKAKGTIRIYNAYSSEPQVLIATTRFLSKEGKLFRLVNKVTVPGAKIENGKIVPSYVDAEVIADKAGENYNIGPTTFTIPAFEGTPRYSKFYAESFSKMTGGYIGTAKIVGQSDFEKAKSQIINIASISLNEELKSKLKKGDIVLDDAKIFTLDNVSTNPQIGEKTDEFEITGKVILKALVFNEDDIKQVFIAEAKKNNPQFEDKELFSYQFNYGAPRVDFDKKLLSFPVEAQLVFREKINSDDFVNNLTGKSIKELESFFKKFNNIEKVDISIWPNFLKFTPLNSSRIKLLIDNSTF
jgi:hypothetical protein